MKGDAEVGTCPDYGTVQKNWFFNNYPSDFTDENNLSIVATIQYNDFKILFGGDIEKAGWLKLLERSDFRSELGGINIFVASIGNLHRMILSFPHYAGSIVG